MCDIMIKIYIDNSTGFSPWLSLSLAPGTSTDSILMALKIMISGRSIILLFQGLQLLHGDQDSDVVVAI